MSETAEVVEHFLRIFYCCYKLQRQ